MRVLPAFRPTLRALVAVVLVCAVGSACDCDTKTRAVFGSIAVDPIEIDFGDVALGTAGDHLVDVRNTGNGGLDVQPPDTSALPAAFHLQDVFKTDCSSGPRTVDSTGATTIDGSDCARLRVRFVPTEVGPVEGTIVLDSSDNTTPKTTIHVKGNGVASSIRVCVLDTDGTEPADGSTCSQLDANPPVIPTVDFGSAPIGDKVTRTVRVHNDGGGSLVVSNLTTESDFPDFSLDNGVTKGTVDPAKYLDVPVDFKPSGDGTETGSLIIESTDTHTPVNVPLTGKAEGPELCIQPSAGLDFGSLPVGTSRALTLDLKNCGHVDYNLTQLNFSENVTQGDFVVTPGNIPSLPHDLPPGAEVTVELTFTPSAVATFTGQFHIATDYQQGNVPVTGVGAPAACSGTNRPTAKVTIKSGSTDITSNPTVQPLTTVTFSATGSTVPRGGATYKWLLKSQPQNGTQNVTSATGATTRLFAELDGDYVVELVATDQFGCDSAPVDATVHVKSNGKLHIQLTWDQSYGDVDLHLIGPGGTFADFGNLFGTGATDCFYGTCKPEEYSIDWGSGGTTAADGTAADDPTLDIDQLWGNGPENITDTSPFASSQPYTVVVHYYCSRQDTYGGSSFGPATARVKIFVNGVQQGAEYTQSLHQRDKWTVATIKVNTDGSITVTPSTAALGRSTANQACSSDTN